MCHYSHIYMSLVVADGLAAIRHKDSLHDIGHMMHSWELMRILNMYDHILVKLTSRIQLPAICDEYVFIDHTVDIMILC